MKKIFRLMVPLVLLLTFVSSLHAEEELSQAQLNDIAAKMIPIYHILLLSDEPTDHIAPPEANITSPDPMPTEVNSTELDIAVTGEADATIWVNGTQVGTLTNGEANITLDLSTEGDNNFTITLKDSAGNESDPIDIIIDRDTTKPDTPVVPEPNPIPEVVHNNELPITVTGEVGAKVFIDGDYKGLIDGNGTLDVPLELIEGNNTFDISLEDSAGNMSDVLTIGPIEFIVLVPAPTVQFIQDINPDDEKLTDGELGGSTTVDVKITFASDTTTSDKLMYKDEFSSSWIEKDINSTMLSNGYVIQMPLITSNPFQSYELHAQIESGANSSVVVSDETQYIGENANLNIVIDTDNNPKDGNITIQERNNTNEVNVTVTFNDLDESKTYHLNLTATNGSTTMLDDFDLNASTIANGYTLTYTVTVDALFEVTAQLSESSIDIGNPAEVNATILKGYPGNPTIEIIDDGNDNGEITIEELSGDVTVVGTLPPGAVAGDVLILSDGYVTAEHTLTATEAFVAIFSYDFPAITGNLYNFCVTLKNDVGLTSDEVCDSAKIVDFKHLQIFSTQYGNVNNDGSTFVHVIPTHLQEDDNITINIELPNDIELNEELIYSVNDGIPIIIEINGTMMSDGNFSFTIDPTLNEVYTIFAKLKRPISYTNQYAGKYIFKVVDEEPTVAPDVNITEDIDNNGEIESGSELNGTVDVNITLPAGTHVGDILTVTDPSGLKSNIAINQSMIDDGYQIGYLPNMGSLYTITVTVTDASGNISAEGIDFATLVDTYAAKPTITFMQDIDKDYIVTQAELGTDLKVYVRFDVNASDVTLGDTLYIDGPSNIGFVEQHDITQDIIDNGLTLEYGLFNNISQLYTIKAKIEDQLGNTSEVVENNTTVQQ